ncbi:MAG TPA: hypothetical protein VIW92_08085 [Thermoanaerobaculia bacterium]
MAELGELPARPRAQRTNRRWLQGEKRMIPPNEMKDFIHSIVAETMPEEILAFEIEGESIISDLYNGSPVLESSDSHVEYEFLDSIDAQMVLEFVKLITATVGLIKALSELANKQDISREDLVRRWASRMIKAGISKKKADEIAERFVGDLSNILRKN